LEANGVIEKTSCLGVDLEKRFRLNAKFVVADLLVNVRLAVYENERALFYRAYKWLRDLVVDGNELITHGTG
jgi:hypothetical protein